ncbi:VOC family protein [Micromonospora matsumotoense]|uniref:VOC family protein n=1 Tax=Micromonospora matsumotoense TaxID=121616 RepID=UPI0033CC3858
MSPQWSLTVDCARPRELAAFWCVALGYVQAAPPQGFATVRWPRVQAAVVKLVAAGGSVLRVDGADGTPDHVTMADPEGNEFDVL